MTSPDVCHRCGGACPPREIPAELREPWRGMLERTPPVCSACVELMEAKAEESKRKREAYELEREARERQQRIEARRCASGIPLRCNT